MMISCDEQGNHHTELNKIALRWFFHEYFVHYFPVLIHFSQKLVATGSEGLMGHPGAPFTNMVEI